MTDSTGPRSWPNLLNANSQDLATVRPGFDPRVMPSGWLAASAGESPGATLGRLVATTEELLMLARERLAQGHRFDVRWVFTCGDHPRCRPGWNHPTAGPSQAGIRRTGS